MKKRREFLTKALAGAMTASMVAGSMPVTALAVTGSQVAADGTYTSTLQEVLTDDPDPDEGWQTYGVTVSVTVKDGKFSAITVNTDDRYDETNKTYLNKAATGKNSIATKLVGKDATADTINGWDTVSGATIVYAAVKAGALDALSKANVAVDKTSLASAISDAEKLTAQGNYTDDSWSAFQNALTSAKKVNENADATQTEVDNAAKNLTDAKAALKENDEYTYGYAALTWSEYWANEKVYAAGSTESSDELDSKKETDKGAFDAVSRATTNHGLHRGSFQCTTTIYCTDGTSYGISHWTADQKSFVTTDGKTVGYSKGTLTTEDGTTHTLKNYKVFGIKYVPVKVKTSELEAFKAKYTFVENGSTLQGGYSEQKLSSYTAVADVDANTNGLKTVTKNGDSFSFSAAQTGTTSGIKDQELKTATGIETIVKDASGAYGEFLRVDLGGDYGDLGSKMQSVTWTYYGDDSTYTNALQTYGTKFAADNWMHKTNNIQLGLTESVRCQLPKDKDGTGYWSLTVHALGYADYTTKFKVSSDNIVGLEPATKSNVDALQKLYDQGATLDEADYTSASWDSFKTELDETKDLLDKKGNLSKDEKEYDGITDGAVTEQTKHLQDAINALVKENYTYGYAALTWSEYWANEDVYAAGSTESSDELDSKGETDLGAFDVVSRATTNHGLHRGSFQCTTTIYCTDGTSYGLSYWSEDQKSFVTTDGKTVGYNRGTLTTEDGTTHTLDHYEVSGIKYVPVRVKDSELEAFKEKYTFVENGSTLRGGYSEQKLSSYTAVAEVDADTNGLKTAAKNGDSFSFSAAKTGTTSGIKDQELKTATGITTLVQEGDGSYGEFLRVDLGGDYGDLGGKMQSVTWTYYGDDSTYTKAIGTYGTKFAADNWMHKTNNIQLGLTESVRCQLPKDADGTGYWSITVHALGYADYTTTFEVTKDNIAEPIPAKKTNVDKLQSIYDTASSLIKGNYSEKSWESFETEFNETKDMLDKKGNYSEDTKEYDGLTNAAVLNQIEHLQNAIDALVRTAPSVGDYILMNIPYDEFYAKETDNNATDVDVFTSATKNKVRTGGLAGGSYHKDSTGDEILGITYAVKVSEEAADKIDWSKYTQITDSSSVDVTVTNRGTTSTTTYTGKDALFEADTYSYYLAGKDQPTNYKELTVADDGSLEFSEVKGAEAKEIIEASYDFTTTSQYGDYELDLSDATKSAMGENLTVYGVVINTEEGESYGLRHLENIWRVTDLAWCSTTQIPKVHNCPTSYEHYKDLAGQNITSLTYYTSNGTFEVKLSEALYVPIKTNDEKVEVVDGKAGTNSTEISATLPAGFEAAGTVTGLTGAKVSDIDQDGKGTISYENALPGSYTLTLTDASGKNAALSTNFILAQADADAKYNEVNKAPALVAADGKTDEQFNNYISNISSVTVNGKAYNASGRGSVAIINKDGTVKLDAASGETKIFGEYGRYTITVSSTGYTDDLEFTFEVINTEDIDSEIKASESYDESKYTKESWKAYKEALENAQKALEDKESQDAIDSAAKALNDASAALVKRGDKDKLSSEVDSAKNLKESDYTADSWKAYTEAKKAADEVLNNEDATQEEIDAAKAALETAVNALKAVDKKSDQKTDDKKTDQKSDGKTTDQKTDGKTTGQNTTDQKTAAKTADQKSTAKKTGKSAKTGDVGTASYFALALGSLAAAGFGFKRKKNKK